MHHRTKFNSTTEIRYDPGEVGMITYFEVLSQKSPRRNYEVTRETLVKIIAFRPWFQHRLPDCNLIALLLSWLYLIYNNLHIRQLGNLLPKSITLLAKLLHYKSVTLLAKPFQYNSVILLVNILQCKSVTLLAKLLQYVSKFTLQTNQVAS